MAEKRLLLGDEAVALGALYAGLSGVYAYPGTPSTEITESVTKGAVVIAVTPAENGYYLWPQKNVYISSDLVDIWQAVERDGSMLIYCTVDINLLQAPDPASGDIGYKLVGGRAYDAKYEMDGYFVIPLTAEGELGFIPMSAEGVYEVPRSN